MRLRRQVDDLKSRVRFLQGQVERQNERHWELYRAHQRLLKHLGLRETLQPCVTIIKTEDGEQDG